MIDSFDHDTDEDVSTFETQGLRILSDLHLYGREDPLYQRFVQWLGETPPGDTVALLGDIFDVWVGRSAYFRNRYHEFFDELKRLSEGGSKVIYIEGNHDFLMRDVFSDIGRFDLVETEREVRIGDQRIYLAHGDLANPDDTGYLRLRRLFRSQGFQSAVRLAPGTLIAAIGSKMSRYSRARNTPVDEKRSAVEIDHMRSVYRNFAIEKFREGYDHVVMGHCHDDDTFEVTVDGRPCAYLNVGFPRKHRTFLEYDVMKKAFVRKPL